MRDIHLVPVSYFPSENLEFPMIADLQTTITPNELFYVRNHFEYPQIDINTWNLTVEGLVERPIQLTYSDLKSLNRVRVATTLECAGNKRSLFEKKAQGNQLGLGAISHAVWGGVRLKDVLHEAGVSSDVTEFVFAGLDSGQRNDMDGRVFFERSLPVDKALHPDTLLAYEMNGEPLPDKHGFPIRLIVPGWYAVASVKWLQRIRAVDNGTNIINGYAWAGSQSVTKVEISTDGGKHWSEADLVDPDVQYSWRRWSFVWDVQKPGEYTIMSKATNGSGEVQPLKAKWNAKGYLNNSIHAVRVHVIDSKLVKNILH